MKEGQESIFYLVGDDAAALANSNQLEGFRARGVEVLLLGDSIDAFWPERLDSFEDKKLCSVTAGGEELAKIKLETELAGEAVDTEALVAAMKDALGEAVSDVRPTDRLVESAAVLGTAGDGPDLQMQRLLRRAGRPSYAAAPLLEINPRHKLVAGMAARLAAGADIAADAQLLLDLACIQDGDLPKDTARFARRVEALLAGI
jgi:molecular chaperone HtpG